VWRAAVESISGDSGGGLFDDAGNLVAVNWGRSQQHASASTPVSYVAALAQRFYSALTPTQMMQFCPGGSCPSYGGGGYGGGGVMPPKTPVGQLPPQWQTQPPPQWQTQPQAPLVPIPQQPAAPQLSAEDLRKLVDQLADAMKPKPDPKPDPKADPQEITLDELAARVAAKLPPLSVDKYVDGKKTGRVEIHLGRQALELHYDSREKPPLAKSGK